MGTKIMVEIGKPDGWSANTKYKYRDVTDWCEDCFLDRESFKCRLAIGRPKTAYLDDEIKYMRPQECKQAVVKRKSEPLSDLEAFIDFYKRLGVECVVSESPFYGGDTTVDAYKIFLTDGSTMGTPGENTCSRKFLNECNVYFDLEGKFLRQEFWGE